MPYSIRPTISGRKRRSDIKEQMSGSDPELMREFDRHSNLSNLSPTPTASPKGKGFNIFDIGLGGDPDFGPIKKQIAEKQNLVRRARGLKALKRMTGVD
jgi:hypothetical protein